MILFKTLIHLLIVTGLHLGMVLNPIYLIPAAACAGSGQSECIFCISIQVWVIINGILAILSYILYLFNNLFPIIKTDVSRLQKLLLVILWLLPLVLVLIFKLISN